MDASYPYEPCGVRRVNPRLSPQSLITSNITPSLHKTGQDTGSSAQSMHRLEFGEQPSLDDVRPQLWTGSQALDRQSPDAFPNQELTPTDNLVSY